MSAGVSTSHEGFAEFRKKVTGGGVYAFDICVDRMLHGKLLRSPHAHARICSIDLRAALQIPGVVSIVTGEDLRDLPDPWYGVGLRDQPVIAMDRVRYAGDVVAAVTAVDEETAFRATQAIIVDYEPLPALMSVAAALAPGAPLIFEEPTRGVSPVLGAGSGFKIDPAPNVLYEYNFAYGDADHWLGAADQVFTDTFEISRINHYHLEPYVNVAWWSGSRVEMWSCNQDPFVLRADISRIFGMPVNDVRIHTPLIGGGFGGKSYCKMEPLLALMARKSGAPVRLALSMDESLLTLVKHPASLTLTTGLDAKGRLLARRARIDLDGGAYCDASTLVAIKTGFRIGGPYAWEAIDSCARVIRTTTVPSGSFRGFGGTQASWASERQMDMIARRRGEDPLALRRRNLLKVGQPFAPNDSGMDCDLAAGLDQLVAQMPPSPRKSGRGLGFAIGIKDAGGTGNHAQAQVRLNQRGDVMVSAATVDIGQGGPAAMCAIATQALGRPFSSATYAAVDTEHTPPDNGTHVSCATTITGLAIEAAALDARAQLLAFGAARLGCNPADLELEGWSLRLGAELHPLEPMIRSYYGGVGWEFAGRGSFKEPYNPATPMGARNVSWMPCWSGAEVEVDGETGQVAVLRLVVGGDAGRALDLGACHGQIEGAAAQAFAQAMFEELRYQGETPANATPLTYRVPRAADMPAQFSSFVAEHGLGAGPGGLKGIGEAGMVGIAAAIANAIEDACGASLTRIPFTPERVLEALDAQSSSICAASK